MAKAGATLMAVAVAAAIATAAAIEASAPAGSAPFEEHPIAVPDRLLFDVGVVDFDVDDDLDVYTINHNDPQALLANRGNGTFVDRLSAVDLDHSPEFPGFEARGSPAMPVNGVYLFRVSGVDPAEGALGIVVRANPLHEVEGTVEFPFPVTIREEVGAEATTELDAGQAPPRHVVSFTSQGNARLVLEPEQMAAPIDVKIEKGYPPSSIFVGPSRVSPGARRFTLHLRDRHGMAWGDYNLDGLLDVFIARGGLKGRVGELGGLIADELMLGNGSTFRDAIAASGLRKGTCRSRETTPVDFNRDGRLDLFWTCQGSTPVLYRQNSDGTFSDASKHLPRVRISGGNQHASIGEQFEWLNVNGKGREELIVTKDHKLVVYGWRRHKRRWSKRDAIRTRGFDEPGQPTVADYDNDGDPDLFAPSETRNTLLINRSGRFRARSPARFGLPKSGSFTASWVDYDNDGHLDLHAAPQGLFRRGAHRGFHATGLATAPTGTLDARVTWFDANNDGTRELLLAAANPGWGASLYENTEVENHWLQVELAPESGAGPSAGARVRVRTGGRTQTQWVGQNDGSHYSQGHYRLYFGLEDVEEARWVKVIWPDHSKQKLNRVPADRLLHVSFGRP